MVGISGRSVCPWVAAVTLLLACGDDDGPALVPDAGPATPEASLDATDDRTAPEPDAGPPLGATGASCTADADCRTGLTCFLGPEGARAWPGGYCTRSCVGDADCPGGSLCGPAYYDGDTPDLRCLATCDREPDTRGGCRDGYRCTYDGVCRIGCSTDLECQRNDIDPGPPIEDPEWTCNLDSARCIHEGNTAARALGECTEDVDCRPPRGICRSGMCFQPECDLGAGYACADGEVCVSLFSDPPRRTTFCWPACDPAMDGSGDPTDACLGFSCLPREKDVAGVAESAFCYPLPVITGGDATIGDACTATADCRNPHGYVQCIDGHCIGSYCAAPSLAELDVCGDPGATCVVPESLGDYLDHDRALGLCLRDCSEDPGACAAGSSCQEGVCL